MGWLALGLLLALATGYWLAAWIYLHPMRESVNLTPSDTGLPFETISLTTSDGVRLVGWMIPADAPRGLVVLCHGYLSQRGSVLGLAPELHKAGYTCVMFDFRRHGESGGDMSTLGHLERRDLIAALDYAERLPGHAGMPIGVLGISMGGAVAIMVAAEDRRVLAVVSDSAYADLGGAVNAFLRRSFGPFSFLGTPIKWIGERQIGRRASDVSPEKTASKLSPRPLLLIHGDEDVTVPVRDAERIFAAAREPKELWRLPNVHHVGAFGAANVEYTRRVVRFFNQTLRK